ncbi:MAG: hypothetical protein ACR2K3_08380 [Nocardioides sp.]
MGDPSLLAGLHQPDQRSCGATCAVAARMLTDPAYAARLRGDQSAFGAEVLAAHRRLCHWTADGSPQLPWPRPLGTQPLALAAGLGHTLGRRYRITSVRRAVRAPVHDPVALYVGNRWLPRHVVLVVAGDADTWLVHDPASGRLVTVPTRGTHPALGGWTRWWWALTPSARRTPA